MATTVTASLKWRLKKFSHFKQVSKKEVGKWKDFEAVDGKPELMFNIAESGHVWVTQSQELLDSTYVLLGAKLHPKLDVLVINSSVQGESRIMRMMFAGSSREEAVEQCSRAVAKLRQFVVTSPPPVGVPPPPPPAASCSPPPPPHQPPADPTAAPAKQSGPVVGEVVDAEPEVAQGSLSIRHLAQSLLGERTLSLPETYRRSSPPQGGDDLGPFVRMCLLDPAFPAYVEEVERELKKLAQD